MSKKRAPSLRETLASLEAEADQHGQSRLWRGEDGATVRYRSKVEGQQRRRQMIVGRAGVRPGVIELQTFQGYGYVPRDVVEAAYTVERDGVTWHYVTLTWSVPIVTMPQADLPL